MNQCSKTTLPNSKYLWIDNQTKNGSVITCVTYSHLVATLNNIDNFRERQNENFYTLNNNIQTFFCLGDINVDLTQISNNEAICRYANFLTIFSCKCVIDLPTQIGAKSKALIDHIYTSKKNECHLIWYVKM